MTEGDFYIFLTSRDSLRYHPDNRGYDFTVELPERVELKGNWKVALCDIFLNEKISNSLMVFSDICEYSFVRDSIEPILRILIPNNRKSHIFPDRYYMGVRQSNLGRIKIYIKDSSLNNAVALKGEIQLTLHLKKEDG